ncbi:hypothetical protein HDU93_004428, partial [Gonapodya sp. JEL0774]
MSSLDSSSDEVDDADNSRGRIESSHGLSNRSPKRKLPAGAPSPSAISAGSIQRSPSSSDESDGDMVEYTPGTPGQPPSHTVTPSRSWEGSFTKNLRDFMRFVPRFDRSITDREGAAFRTHMIQEIIRIYEEHPLPFNGIAFGDEQLGALVGLKQLWATPERAALLRGIQSSSKISFADVYIKIANIRFLRLLVGRTVAEYPKHEESLGEAAAFIDVSFDYRRFWERMSGTMT